MTESMSYQDKLQELHSKTQELFTRIHTERLLQDRIKLIIDGIDLLSQYMGITQQIQVELFSVQMIFDDAQATIDKYHALLTDEQKEQFNKEHEGKMFINQ